MATTEDLRALQHLAPPHGYDEAELGGLLDTLGMDATLARLWAERTVATSTLVDITESGSSRKMSAIHNQAKGLASMYADRVAAAEQPSVTSNAAISRRMTR